MMISTLRIRLSLFIAAIFLLFAPYWAPYCQVLHDHNLFLTADSMVLLGVTLIAGLCATLLMPSSLLTKFERLAAGVDRRATFLIIIFLAAIMAGLFALNRLILHSFMNSADEHSCYFLAECFRIGKWWVKPHPLAEFFDVVHVGDKGGKWFSVYPFGWPLLLMMGRMLRIQDWMNPLISVLSLALIFKAGGKVFGRFAAVWGMLAVAVTPFFMFTSASYFSHSTCLLTMAAFILAYLKWREAKTGRGRMIWATIAAIAMGYGLATRYLTMAAFAAPFVVYQFYPVIRRREKISRDQIVFLGVVVFFFLLVFFQNTMISGNPFKAPNRYDKSWERLGFRDDYTVIDGLVFVLARAFYLMDWAPPVFLVLYIASLFVKRRMETVQTLLRYAFLFPVIAYFFYFSWGGNQYGPRYYYEGFPFMMLALMEAVRFWWRMGSASLRKFLAGIMLFSLIANGYLFYKQSEYFEDASRQRKALFVLAEAELREPSIVFIRGFLGQRLVLGEEDAVRNSPALDGLILYAHDKGAANKKLMAYYPNRRYYLGYFNRDIKQAKLEVLTP